MIRLMAMASDKECFEIMGITACIDQNIVITTARGAKISGKLKRYSDRFETICVEVVSIKKLICVKLRYVFMLETIPEECKRCIT
jgi:hypothetical protein